MFILLYCAMFTFVLLCVLGKMKKKVEELQKLKVNIISLTTYNTICESCSLCCHIFTSVIIVCTG